MTSSACTKTTYLYKTISLQSYRVYTCWNIDVWTILYHLAELSRAGKDKSLKFCLRLTTLFSLTQHLLETSMTVDSTVNMVIFHWGKISWKWWQDLSRGGNFHDHISHISLIKSYGFYFPWGKFSRKRSYREKRQNWPHAKMSTFTIFLCKSNSQTCVQRSPLGKGQSGHLRQVAIYSRSSKIGNDHINLYWPI